MNLKNYLLDAHGERDVGTMGKAGVVVDVDAWRVGEGRRKGGAGVLGGGSDWSL